MFLFEIEQYHTFPQAPFEFLISLIFQKLDSKEVMTHGFLIFKASQKKTPILEYKTSIKVHSYIGILRKVYIYSSIEQFLNKIALHTFCQLPKTSGYWVHFKAS